MRAAAKPPEGGAQDGAAARPMAGRLWVDRAPWADEVAYSRAKWAVFTGFNHGLPAYNGSHHSGTARERGALRCPGDFEYVGEFRDEVPDGHGRVKDVDGNVYLGEWRDGVPHGRGRDTFADGVLFFEGEWARGRPTPRSVRAGGVPAGVEDDGSWWQLHVTLALYRNPLVYAEVAPM